MAKSSIEKRERFAHESFRAERVELDELGRAATALGLSRSEVIRRALRIAVPILRKAKVPGAKAPDRGSRASDE